MRSRKPGVQRNALHLSPEQPQRKFSPHGETGMKHEKKEKEYDKKSFAFSSSIDYLRILYKSTIKTQGKP